MILRLFNSTQLTISIAKKGNIEAIINDRISLIFTKNANSFIFIFTNTPSNGNAIQTM